jgi:pimeloyl-ACP methyl ester carboxylesterase
MLTKMAIITLLASSAFGLTKPEPSMLTTLKTSENFQGLYTLTSGRTLNIKFEKGEIGKPFIYLIHGLGDEISKLDQLSREMHEQGYNVLRVDTALSGHSLQFFLKQNKIKNVSNFSKALPVKGYSFDNNVNDLVEIALQTEAPSLYIVGHSYGGALAWEVQRVLSEKHARQIKVLGTVMIAPYLQRIDKYIREKLTNRTGIVDILNRQKSLAMNVTSVLKSMGAWWLPSADAIEEIYEPFEDALFHKLQTQRSFRDYFNTQLNKDHFLDQAIDPVTNALIKESYVAYFTTAYPKDSKQMTAIRAQAAMSLTVGIREFDLLNYSQKLSLKNLKPILVIRGQADKLVKDTQVADFVYRIRQESAKLVEYKIITNVSEGQQPGHLIPQTHAKEIKTLIKDYIEQK